ncbi:MAG: pilus assembly protein [Pseudomonadota bacterium]
MRIVQQACHSLACPKGPPSPDVGDRPKKPRLFLQRFAEEKSGTVAAIFAMLTPIVFGIVGGAIDTGRWLATRDATLQAMDAAVLAAGRTMQMNGATLDEAIATARTYFDENKPGRLSREDVQFTVEENGTLVVSVSDSAVNTPFLSILGIRELPVTATSKAILAADGNAGTNIEISIMMDVTGSMCYPCRKIEDLKVAAKDLIDIVVWDDQSEYSSRVALAPFSEYVNVGSDYYRRVTKEDPSGTGNQRTCVAERVDNTFMYRDDWTNNRKRLRGYLGGGTCKTRQTIMPLSNDKDALKAHIDSLTTDGWTAGHLGVAWSWYTLSPNFNRLWPNRLDADADPYAHLDQTNTVTIGDSSYEVPKLKKIAVLMTDGVFNSHKNGVDSATQARELCDAMKAKKIEVYAVGFEVGDSGGAYDVMSYCASSDEHFYNAEDGNALRVAFRDIGLKISTLRLSE